MVDGNMELLNTHPVKKSDLGFHGNLFGGKLLAWLDAGAAAFEAIPISNRVKEKYGFINNKNKNN